MIDDDDMMATLLCDYLEGMQIPVIDRVGDGESAWKLIQEKEYQLIVLDWKLPSLTGLALFNRIRGLNGYAYTPVCISSGLLTREDCFLLDEYPVTTLLEKPFTEDLFLESVEKLLGDFRWHDDNWQRIESLVEGLRAGHAESGAELRDMLASSPNPGALTVNVAKSLRAHGFVKEAEAMLSRFVEKRPNSLLALSEWGKALFQLGRYDEAHAVLNKAQQMSPRNLGRLCMIGEIELAKGDASAAAKTFKQALAIDAKSEKAQAGLVSAENVGGLSDAERGGVEVLKSMAGLLNITAISLIKRGQHEKAIEQYKAALHFVEGGLDKARIAFNLGLGFVRWNRHQEAEEWLNKSLDYSQGGFDKAKAVLARLRGAKSAPLSPTEVVGEYEEILPQ